MPGRIHRNTHPKLFAELRNVIIAWDPAGFIKLGAPDDEYDCIVGQIINKHLNRLDEDALADWLRIEVDEHFGISEDNIDPLYIEKLEKDIEFAKNSLLSFFSERRQEFQDLDQDHAAALAVTDRRITALNDLIALSRPVDLILSELRGFTWDSPNELVVLTTSALKKILERFWSGEVSETDLEKWGNAIEGRDDIAYSDSKVVENAIYDLANPAISAGTIEMVADRYKSLLENE